jgi:general secretion pathway protein I
LYASGSYAQHISIANGLARCKMSELEERLLKFGYPEIDENDEGLCCVDDTHENMHCTWKVERIELPQPQNVDMLSGGSTDAGAGLSLSSALDAAGGLAAGSATAGGVSGAAAGLGPLGALAQLSTNPQALGSDGGIANLASSLSGSMAGGTAAIAPLVMSMVYPQLKPMLEASIRKITVTVGWREGLKTRDLGIVQYVTNPMRGGLIAGQQGDGGIGLPGLPGGGMLGGGTPGGGLPAGIGGLLQGLPGMK